MGGWKIEYWKYKKDGEHTTDELNDADLEHIAQAIKDGCTSGEVTDEE